MATHANNKIIANCQNSALACIANNNNIKWHCRTSDEEGGRGPSWISWPIFCTTHGWGQFPKTVMCACNKSTCPQVVNLSWWVVLCLMDGFMDHCFKKNKKKSLHSNYLQEYILKMRWHTLVVLIGCYNQFTIYHNTHHNVIIQELSIM